jgi:hypothetical protein
MLCCLKNSWWVKLENKLRIFVDEWNRIKREKKCWVVLFRRLGILKWKIPSQVSSPLTIKRMICQQHQWHFHYNLWVTMPLVCESMFIYGAKFILSYHYIVVYILFIDFLSSLFPFLFLFLFCYFCEK